MVRDMIAEKSHSENREPMAFRPLQTESCSWRAFRLEQSLE